MAKNQVKILIISGVIGKKLEGEGMRNTSHFISKPHMKKKPHKS